MILMRRVEPSALEAVDSKRFAQIAADLLAAVVERSAGAVGDAGHHVKVGDHVSAESIVCVVEAMKVFNEIPAEVSGRIVAVLVENEESVEFGKPLFKVDTST